MIGVVRFFLRVVEPHSRIFFSGQREPYDLRLLETAPNRTVGFTISENLPETVKNPAI